MVGSECEYETWFRRFRLLANLRLRLFSWQCSLNHRTASKTYSSSQLVSVCLKTSNRSPCDANLSHNQLFKQITLKSNTSAKGLTIYQVYSAWFLVRNWLPWQRVGSQVEIKYSLNNIILWETSKEQTSLSASKNVWKSAHEIVIGITKAPTGNYRRVTRFWDLTWPPDSSIG